MGGVGSKDVSSIVEMAKVPCNYTLPLGPPNPVSVS